MGPVSRACARGGALCQFLSVHDCVCLRASGGGGCGGEGDCALASVLCVIVAHVSVSDRVSRYLHERVCVALGHCPRWGTSSSSPGSALLSLTEYSLSLGAVCFTYVLSFMPHKTNFLTPTPCQAPCIWGLRGQASSDSMVLVFEVPHILAQSDMPDCISHSPPPQPGNYPSLCQTLLPRGSTTSPPSSTALPPPPGSLP